MIEDCLSEFINIFVQTVVEYRTFPCDGRFTRGFGEVPGATRSAREIMRPAREVREAGVITPTPTPTTVVSSTSTVR